MISHTHAFDRYRKLSQAHLDFVVLVCYAVPALRADLSTSAVGVSHRPDHFRSANSKEALKRCAAIYQGELGRSTLIAIFSYFESYVGEAMRELSDFHGGDETFETLAQERSETVKVRVTKDMAMRKRKLQEYAKKGKDLKYRDQSHLLDAAGFRFPTELFARYGALKFLEKTKEKRGMRAWEIPDLLEQCFLFPLSEADRKEFEHARRLRNSIGHGKAPSAPLKASLQIASKLHNLAARIDRYLLEHFFVLQRFA